MSMRLHVNWDIPLKNALTLAGLLFLLFGMLLWSLFPTQPSMVLPANATLVSPDTNYPLAKGFYLTPFGEWRDNVAKYVSSLPINSVDDAAVWVLAHTINDGVHRDYTDAWDMLEAIMNGQDKIYEWCGDIVDLWILILRIKKLSPYAGGIEVKVEGGNNPYHEIGYAASADGKSIYFFYTWPYGYKSAVAIGQMAYEVAGAKTIAQRVDQTLNSVKPNFPTRDGWYSIDSLTPENPPAPQQNVTEVNGCPMIGSYNPQYSSQYNVSNCTVCPYKSEITAIGQAYGTLQGWISRGKLLLRTDLSADWPHADEVTVPLTHSKEEVCCSWWCSYYWRQVPDTYVITITCPETMKTVKILPEGWYSGCNAYAYTVEYLLEGSSGTWVPVNGPRWGVGGYLLPDGHPAYSLGGSIRRVIWRNYGLTANGDYSGGYPIEEVVQLAAGDNHPRIIHLMINFGFPLQPHTAEIEGGTVTVSPRWWGPVILTIDTSTLESNAPAQGELKLILNQDFYAPNETAIAWIKASQEITSVNAKIKETGSGVTFAKDSADGTVWRAQFTVPSITGTYTLVADTNLGSTNTTFTVTTDQQQLQNQEPITIKFDREPPEYHLNDNVTFTAAVNVNGTYELKAYVTGPTGAVQSVPLNKIGTDLWQGVYRNTIWQGTYKLTVVLNGTGCVFHDTEANNVKATRTFNVHGTPQAIKVWFDRTSYDIGDTVTAYALVNPPVGSVTGNVDQKIDVTFNQVHESLWKAQFQAPAPYGEHHLYVSAGGITVDATFTVSNVSGQPILIVQTDRDTYIPGDVVKIYAQIQNAGGLGMGIYDPKIIITKPDGKTESVEAHVDEGYLIYGQFADTQEPGQYTAKVELDYGSVLSRQHLTATKTFTVAGASQPSGNFSLGSLTQPNEQLYQFLVSHGVPADAAKILAMPITWIALGFLLILLAAVRRGRSEYSSYRAMARVFRSCIAPTNSS